MNVLVLGRSSISTDLLINRLEAEGYAVIWVEENRADKISLLGKRVTNFGLIYVLDQIIFLIFQRLLRALSKKRTNEFREKPRKGVKPLKTVSNLNEVDERFFTKINYDLVVLSGTRIISENVLNLLGENKVINIHAGITPKYRGVHGGYWALVNREPDMFGSTIHYVDKGIDTGKVISYVHTKPSMKDNFVTYPLLQQSLASECLAKLIPNIIDDKVELVKTYNIESKLWSHPTFSQYLLNYIRFGVK